MRSRREQIRAYRFVTRRIVSALLGGDPETADPPLRRAGLTTFASVMVGALVLAGFGVYGLVRPGGSTSWRDGDSLIVAKDTGTRYVYRGDRLHPVLNYASARLVLGAAEPNTVSVSAESLAGVPRGRPVGIAHAPDALPAADSLHALPWSVCSASTPTTAKLQVTVAVHRQFGGTDLGDGGLLVSASGERPALLWHGQRLRIPSRAAMLSLGWTSKPQVTVAPALLNAIPAGPDLVTPDIERDGEPGPTVGAEAGTIGTVYRVATAGSDSQYFVLLGDGLAKVSPLVKDLLLVSQNRVSPEALSPADFAHVPSSAKDVQVDGLPDTEPRLANEDGDRVSALCVSRGAHGRPRIEHYRTAPDALTGRADAAAGGTDEKGGLTADAVLVPGGTGALIRPTASQGVPTGVTYLVTDQGIRYAVPNDDARTALGYGDVTAVRLPESLLDLVPAGPVLDPAATGQYVPAAPSPSPSQK